MSRSASRPGGVPVQDVGATGVEVVYQPILDVARGIPAGYQAQVHRLLPGPLDLHSPGALGDDSDGRLTASAIRTAFAAFRSLPVNTFLSFPLGVTVAGLPAVRDALQSVDSLGGIVLDIVGPVDVRATWLAEALAGYRAAGAVIAVGGHGAPQPELTSIVRLKPAIVRLGRDWVRGLDSSQSKRSAVEVIGNLAGQLDAWILAEGVSTTAELRALAGLSVPLAQGSLIGEAQTVWPDIPRATREALPRPVATSDGVLRELVQQAYTATDAAAAAAVLPETTGFDVVVIVDDRGRPLTLLEQDGTEQWDAYEVLDVNIDTPVAAAVQRAMTRPRATRFTPLACTDDQGRFVGILRIDSLMTHLNRRT